MELQGCLGIFDRECRTVGRGDIVVVAGTGGENIDDAPDHQHKQDPEFDAFEEIHRWTVA